MLATVRAWDEGFSADRICLCDIGLDVWNIVLQGRYFGRCGWCGGWKCRCWQESRKKKIRLLKKNRGNTTSSMGQRAGSKVGAVLDTKNKVKDKANAVKENIKDMPTQTAYAVYSAKEKAKSSVSDFKRGMVQEQQSRQTGRLEKQEQHRQNIADKRMELQKAQEARQAQRKADGSATTGATRPP